MEKYKRSLAAAFIIFTIISLTPFAKVALATDAELKLPTTPVRIEVFNGTESYFVTKLLDVPPGYDVTNGTYLGWCIDTRAEMTRSPATHQVRLYSSLNPPEGLQDEKWDMVNYILNHKRGTAMDIQEAIWYFIHMNSEYTPQSPVAWEIINDALTNGSGFVPDYGQELAIICYPLYMLPAEVQISIIEIANPIIPEFQPAHLLLLIMVTTLTATIISKKWAKSSSVKPKD